MRISDWSSDVCSSDLAGPTDEVSDSGDAPVSPRRRLTAIGIAAVTPHRAELEYAELAIALPHPHLPEKDGTRTFEPDRDGDKKKKRRQDDEGQDRHHEVERAFLDPVHEIQRTV